MTARSRQEATPHGRQVCPCTWSSPLNTIVGAKPQAKRGRCHKIRPILVRCAGPLLKPHTGSAPHAAQMYQVFGPLEADS